MMMTMKAFFARGVVRCRLCAGHYVRAVECAGAGSPGNPHRSGRDPAHPHRHSRFYRHRHFGHAILPLWCAPIWNCSGLFKPLNPASFIEKIADINTPPRFGDWRTIQAQGLVTGQAVAQPDGRLTVDFRLWDIFGETQMVGQRFATTPENWRRIAHLISDAIYERITGEKGYFDTRVVFIATESGPKLNRRKRLSVMDQDGANPVFLTQGDYLVLTPRFNPTAQMIAYMSYIQGKPRVYLFDPGNRPPGSPGQFSQYDRFRRAFRRTARKSDGAGK